MAVDAETAPAPLNDEPRPRAQTLILACFFVSGMAGLIYEIIWTRLLALVMGATVYSLTTVLVAFMAGLGLGAYLIAGPLRRHPEWSRLRLYGVFEIIIGLWCLALPRMIDAAEPLLALIYNRLYGDDPGALLAYSLAQFAVIVPLMLVPTTLMGATLPLLADHVARRPEAVGRGVGKVYGINTFGAMFGALGAGYVFVPLLGFTGTNWLAVWGNLLVGATALVLARGEQRIQNSELRIEKVQSSGAAGGVPQRVVVAVFVIFGLSGMASMAYQVAWTRVISLIIDSTTYSFTIIVTCFILGLALGAWLLSPMIDRERRPVMLLGLLQVAVGVTALVTVPILGWLSPSVFFMMIRFHEMWWLLQALLFAIVLAMLILPTMLMGATFPLVAKILARRRGEVGSVVGRAYGVNALGTIAGAFVAGFLLVPNPAVGMQWTLVLATALNLSLGMVAVLLAPDATAWRRLLTGGAALALWVLALTRCVPVNQEGERGWDRDIITASPFFFYEKFFQGSVAADLDFRGYLETFGPRADYREGPFSTVVIREGLPGTGQTHVIYTGGRPEASNTDTQQNLLTHLGMLLHRDPRRVCVVGLGSGTTARAATYHPVLERLDVVEISRAVRDLSGKYFPEIHADLQAVGANIIVADGRNHLALTDQKYDVIVSQPSHPHLAGVASLFTRDFFTICRERLAPGGVCVIWNFAWRVEPDDFRTYMRSFQEVFPASMFLLSRGSYTFMVGFKDDEIAIDWEAITQRLDQCTDPAIVSDLRVSDADNSLVWEDAGSFLDAITLLPRGVEACAGEGPLNTDDNARLEYALPRSFDVDRSVDIRRAARLARDRLTPQPGEVYDPRRHEVIWEYVDGAPAEALPESFGEWREGDSGTDGP